MDQGGWLSGSQLTLDPPSLVELLQATAQSTHTPAPDSVASSAYLDHLVSTPLASLLREPLSVSAESYNVESELTNLCFREYTTFISVHRCAQAVQSAFDDFETSLGRLLDSVPSLEEECRTFSKSTSEISASRAKASLVLEHEDKLLDLLEMPRLMDTCVRNGYYQEAMELASHAEELGKKCEGVLVQDVLFEVRGVEQVMIAQLFALLREPVKLAALVKAVSYLRRLEVGDESSLSLVFLASRLHNFRAALIQVEAERGEPVRYIRKYIDLFREHVYDIIAQHTSIFTDTAHVYSFAGQCVTDLVQLVGSHIPRMGNDSASLSSILVQLGYCALSFARIGLDFSTLIGDPFEQVVLSTYSASVKGATSELVTVLSDAEKNATSPTDVLVSPEHRADVLTADLTVFSLATAHLLPLALFVNAHLAALNALRLLAPNALFPRMVAVQSASLSEATSAVLHYLRSGNADGERPGHRRTPSSPRAHLLRRSTETLLSPEIRLARRREALRLSVVFAQAWDVAMVYLAEGLVGGVYGREGGLGFVRGLDELRGWVRQHREQVPNGTNHQAIAEEVEGHGPEPRTPVRRAVEVEDDVVEIRMDSPRTPVEEGTPGEPVTELKAPPAPRLTESLADSPMAHPDPVTAPGSDIPRPIPDEVAMAPVSLPLLETAIDSLSSTPEDGVSAVGELVEADVGDGLCVTGDGEGNEVLVSNASVELSDLEKAAAQREPLPLEVEPVLAPDPSTGGQPFSEHAAEPPDTPELPPTPQTASTPDSPVEAVAVGGGKKKKKKKGKR